MGKFKLLSVAGAMALGAAAAHAGGSYGPIPITIVPNSTGGGYVEGGMGYVRNTPNRVEFIYCQVKRAETLDANDRPTRQTQQINCVARDAAGVSVSCKTTSLDQVRALAAANGESILGFGYDAAGQCTSIVAYESSSLVPKR